MREKLCIWLYRRGLKSLAYTVSSGVYMRLLSEECRRKFEEDGYGK